MDLVPQFLSGFQVVTENLKAIGGLNKYLKIRSKNVMELISLLYHKVWGVWEQVTLFYLVLKGTRQVSMEHADFI